MCGVIMVGLLAILGLTAFQVTTVGEAEPVREGPSECRPTLANGTTPPSEDASALYHGDGFLYTGLWPDGEVLATPDYIESDGSIRMKWPWLRAALPGHGHLLPGRGLLRDHGPIG